MSQTRMLVAGVVFALPALAGCDGATVAREATRPADATPAEAPGEPATVSSPASEAPIVATSESPSAPTGASTTTGAATVNVAAAVALPEPDASGYIEATFDDVKFEMTKTELFNRAMLTPKVNALFGKQIRIRGYMYPTLRRRGLTQFVLVRDNMECCFGPGAALFDCVLVTMAPGKTAEYSIRPIAVEGAFRLEELPGGPGGRPLAIYQMVGDAVK